MRLKVALVLFGFPRSTERRQEESAASDPVSHDSHALNRRTLNDSTGTNETMGTTGTI
jgi:hypothetical protein